MTKAGRRAYNHDHHETTRGHERRARQFPAASHLAKKHSGGTAGLQSADPESEGEEAELDELGSVFDQQKGITKDHPRMRRWLISY